MDDRLYEERRNANLPFGYWLVVDDEMPPWLIDEEGRRWKSLREYIWLGRLGMADGNNWDRENQIEFLLSVLAAIDRRVVHIEEQVNDFFRGTWDLARHYGSWLEGHGLVGHGLCGSLTPEGRAVLVALASTRSAGSAPVPIGLATIEPKQGLDGGSTRAAREQMFAASEMFAQGLPYRFIREDVAGQVGIKLIGIPQGDNVPLGRVLWSLAFPEDFARDRFFQWLVHRIDRWEAWARLASHDGAKALSELFLLLVHVGEEVSFN